MGSRQHSAEIHPLLAHPLAKEPAEVCDEALVLVRRVQAADRPDEQPVEFGRSDPLEQQLVESREARLAEVRIALGLEVVVREAAVRLELLRVRQVVAVADREVAPGVQVEPRLPARDDAEQAPLHERADRPREVVVQARQPDVRAGVRVVDREDVVTADEALAGVELPAEERVDEPPDRDDLGAGLRRQEVVGDGVAVVQRLLGPEAHDHRLRPDRERAGEDVVAVDRRLQVHHPLARSVIRTVQLARVADHADADPLPAVVRLHEQRIADALGDGVEVERAVVLRGRVRPARVVERSLERHQHRPRHLQPAADHRAVGRMLLHRLERERAVEQVHIVHERDLLQPLTGVVVPVRQPVHDKLVARPVTQVERLDREPFDLDAVALAALPRDRPEAGDQRLERHRPVLLGAEQQADDVVGLWHQQNLRR